MKKIILLLCLAFGMLVNAQDQVNESVTSTINETERIVDKYSDKIYTVVQELAKSLSVPAEYVYKVLVKQAVVDSITYLLILLTGLLLITPIFKVINKVTDWSNLRDKDDNQLDGQFTIAIIVGLCGAFLFLSGIWHMSDIVQGFVNPEYKAIETIIKALK